MHPKYTTKNCSFLKKEQPAHSALMPLYRLGALERIHVDDDDIAVYKGFCSKLWKHLNQEIRRDNGYNDTYDVLPRSALTQLVVNMKLSLTASEITDVVDSLSPSGDGQIREVDWIRYLGVYVDEDFVEGWGSLAIVEFAKMFDQNDAGIGLERWDFDEFCKTVLDFLPSEAVSSISEISFNLYQDDGILPFSVIKEIAHEQFLNHSH